MRSIKFFFVMVAVLFFANCTSTKDVAGLHQMPGKENIRTPEMMSESFAVAGNCETCKKRIERAAKIKGVTQADWDVEKQLITVMYFPQQTNNDAIQKSIAAVGHDTPKYKGDAAAYAKLPSCCAYTRK